jgi:heterotetrameric sarcosine oxidase beta subunit
MAIPGVTQRPLRDHYDVLIAGGGIQGIALAYELALLGVRDIAVVDASWPGAGASGRNGEMIRSAFASEEWTRLFDVSLRRWHGLSAELDFNTLFTPSGYVVLATTEEEVRGLRKQLPLHRRLGVRSEWLDAAQLRELLPAAAPDLLTGGVWQSHAGFAHHDAVLWAYARAAARRGVEIHAHAPVEAIDVAHGRVRGATVAGRSVSTPVVVNATGAFAREVAVMAGVELPTQRYLLEMLVTESLKPFLRPAVASLRLMSYCHQTSRGEFVGGTEFKAVNPYDDMLVTLEALRDITTKFVRLFPQLAGARVVRHWSGLVDNSPDVSPVLGPAPEVDGFILDSGWTYGFMGAPGAAQLLARWIVNGRPDPVIAPFGLGRFRSNRLIREGAIVVPTEEAVEEVA